MRQRTLAALLALTAAPLTASADPPKKGVIEIPVIEIRGRLPKPLAAVDIAKPRATSAPAIVTPSLAPKVEAALDGGPF